MRLLKAVIFSFLLVSCSESPSFSNCVVIQIDSVARWEDAYKMTLRLPDSTLRVVYVSAYFKQHFEKGDTIK